MGILLLLLAALWTAAAVLLVASGIATLVYATCQAGRLAAGNPSHADSDALIRWADGSATTRGQARELAKGMREIHTQKPAPAPFVRGTPDGMFAVQRLLNEQRRLT